MFDIGTVLMMTATRVCEDAEREGRVATDGEVQANLQEAWDRWMDAAVASDMTRAGFVKSTTAPCGWEKPRRGFWAWLRF